jgi:hypothetical protein
VGPHDPEAGPHGESWRKPQPPHGGIRLAHDTPAGAAQHVPGVGLVVEGPDPEKPLVAVPFGRSFQEAPELDLGHPLLEDLPAFLVHLLSYIPCYSHELNLKRGLDLADVSYDRRGVHESGVRKEVLVPEGFPHGRDVQLQSQGLGKSALVVGYQGRELVGGLESYHHLQRRFHPGPFQFPPDHEQRLSLQRHEEETVLRGPRKIGTVHLLNHQESLHPFLLHTLSEPGQPVLYLLPWGVPETQGLAQLLQFPSHPVFIPHSPSSLLYITVLSALRVSAFSRLIHSMKEANHGE